MEKHTKIYLDFFEVSYCSGTGEYEPLKCEYCEKRLIIDVHHIDNKGMGGSDKKDYIENLIGLCRDCHDAAHDEKITKEALIKKHLFKIRMFKIHSSLWN